MVILENSDENLFKLQVKEHFKIYRCIHNCFIFNVFRIYLNDEMKAVYRNGISRGEII